MHRVEIFFAYLGQLVKAQMEYRFDFLVDVTTTLLRQGVDLAFLAILFTKVPRLGGWSFHEVVFIYGFFTLVFGLYNATFLPLITDFADRYLLRAELDQVLTRPLGSLYQVFLERIRPLDLNGVLLGGALMAYAALRLEHEWGILKGALLVPLVLGGFLVYSGFFLAITSINFWFEVRGGIAGPFMNLSRFGRYPITIYGSGLRALLSTAVPFAFIAFYPSALLLGREEYLIAGLATPAVGVAVFALAVFIWRRGILRYQSAGS